MTTKNYNPRTGAEWLQKQIPGIRCEPKYAGDIPFRKGYNRKEDAPNYQPASDRDWANADWLIFFPASIGGAVIDFDAHGAEVPAWNRDEVETHLQKMGGTDRFIVYQSRGGKGFHALCRLDATPSKLAGFGRVPTWKLDDGRMVELFCLDATTGNHGKAVTVSDREAVREIGEKFPKLPSVHVSTLTEALKKDFLHPDLQDASELLEEAAYLLTEPDAVVKFRKINDLLSELRTARRKLIAIRITAEGDGDLKSEAQTALDSVNEALKELTPYLVEIEDQRQAARIEAKDLCDYREKPLNWLVMSNKNGWIPRAAVSILGAHGGAGKTYAALWLALVVAKGKNSEEWFPKDASCRDTPLTVTETGPVLFVTYEDDPERSLIYRAKKFPGINAEEDIPELLHVLNLNSAGPLWAPRKGGHRDTQLGLTETGRLLEDKFLEKEPALVVIDNVSAAFGGNSKEAHAVRTFTNWLSGLASQFNTAVLLIAHLPKREEKDAHEFAASGSADWQNGCRAAMKLEQEKEKGGTLLSTRTLKLVKANYGSPDFTGVKLDWREKGGLEMISSNPKVYDQADAEPATNGQTVGEVDLADDGELPF